MINSYYKTTVPINQLFQKAFDTLAQYDYAEAAAFFEEAFRYDPYRLEAHYILAIHFAAVNDTGRFKEHFFICCNIDPAYSEVQADASPVDEVIRFYYGCARRGSAMITIDF
ncbi:hypothetical protein SAMN05428949_0796 [Chitinophaga sp. YR627]|nr:hypothetical protein SAMN05428949_0796 [Chitinophaga sp. YR627]